MDAGIEEAEAAHCCGRGDFDAENICHINGQVEWSEKNLLEKDVLMC